MRAQNPAALAAVVAFALGVTGCASSAPATAPQPTTEAQAVANDATQQASPTTAPIQQQAEPSAEGVSGTALGGATADQGTVSSGIPVPSAAPVVLGEWRAGEGVAGFDVSRYQEAVNWQGLAQTGHAFVYVKATEGGSHRSPTHDEQRTAAREAGLLQGGYHYARPAQSSGTLQARFFHGLGGGWSADGLTLPGALDLEFAEQGPQCHGLSPGEMVAWVREFSDEYRRLSGRIPVIYTSAEFWDICTGGDDSFADHPLWLFDHAEVPGPLPQGWERPTLWQRGIVDHLDRNVFFGTAEQLAAWASAPLR